MKVGRFSLVLPLVRHEKRARVKIIVKLAKRLLPLPSAQYELTCVALSTRGRQKSKFRTLPSLRTSTLLRPPRTRTTRPLTVAARYTQLPPIEPVPVLWPHGVTPSAWRSWRKTSFVRSCPGMGPYNPNQACLGVLSSVQ
jgi:hypothetical protein